VRREWFQPDWWGTAATAVVRGGRGSAWFLHQGQAHWVLRHYRRGGWVASVSERSYVFTGIDQVRSFAEFRLLNRLVDQGMPVPQPIAAWFERPTAITYHAAIIVGAITDAVPFSAYLDGATPTLWRAVGQLIRRFHDVGLDHADLNCNNILVTTEGLYLIDFDKGVLRPERDGPTRWKMRNLQRLRRSVDKLRADPLPNSRWEAFVEGYAAA